MAELWVEADGLAEWLQGGLILDLKVARPEACRSMIESSRHFQLACFLGLLR